MNENNEEVKELRIQVGELLEGLQRLSEKHNSQYTDIMLKLACLQRVFPLPQNKRWRCPFVLRQRQPGYA
jgi:hypothetical protein